MSLLQDIHNPEMSALVGTAKPVQLVFATSGPKQNADLINQTLRINHLLQNFSTENVKELSETDTKTLKVLFG